MSKFISKYLRCILLLLPAAAQAQDIDWRPSAVRAGVNVWGLGSTAISEHSSLREVQGDIDFSRYFLVMDMGQEACKNAGEGFMHQSDGAFFRAGVDANLTPYNKNSDLVFFGLRYAQSFHHESLRFDHLVPYWGSTGVNVVNNQLTTRWFEAVIGLKVRIWNQFYMGCTLRGKFARKTNGADTLIPYTVPGYGVTGRGGSVGFGYHLYYRFAFRNKPVPLKPKASKKALK